MVALLLSLVDVALFFPAPYPLLRRNKEMKVELYGGVIWMRIAREYYYYVSHLGHLYPLESRGAILNALPFGPAFVKGVFNASSLFIV